MAEALAMLGLVANIFQFIEHGLNVLSSAKEIYESGQSSQARDIRLLLEDIKNTSDQIQTFKPGSLSTDELAIRTYSVECDSIVAELNVLVSKLVARDDALSRKLESLRVAYQNVAKKGDVQRLADRLKDLDARLRIRLQHVLDREAAEARNEQLSSIVAMIDDLDQRARRLGLAFIAEFDNNRRVLKSELQATSAQIFNLVKKLAEDSRKATTHQDLLQSLIFEQMNQRYSDIDPAHVRTLGWMFDNSKTSFPEWLRSDSGIYWISGLAGSGKSTVMKYIYDQSTTHRLLFEWAQNNKLVTAHVFFWNQGTRMQKSQQGLLQSLLFQILKADVDLALDLCRGRVPFEPWTVQELRDTFARLPELAISTTRFCFFIDGLDEYDGHEEDIIRTIEQLASCPEIKVCVSSRPWNRFREAFRCCSGLFVHDMTQPDIIAYIEAELAESKAFKESVERDGRCRSVIYQVAARAQGVFLWVLLVVRSLKRDLQSQEPFEHLQHRVDAMPPTLEDYFRRIFERIDPIYRKETARLFLLCLTLEAQGLEALPLATCLYLEAENHNANYAIEARIEDRPSSEGMQYWRDYKIQAEWKAVTRINDRCKDLLQARVNTSYKKDCLQYAHVSFLHRTVRDFLRDSYFAQLQVAAGDYSPIHSYLMILLSLLKQYPFDLLFQLSHTPDEIAPKHFDPLHIHNIPLQTTEISSSVLTDESRLRLVLAQFWSFAQANESEMCDIVLNQYAIATSRRYRTSWPSLLIVGSLSQKLALPDDLQMLAWATYTNMTGYIKRNWTSSSARKFYDYGIPALSLALEPKCLAMPDGKATIRLSSQLCAPNLSRSTVQTLLALQCKPTNADVSLKFLEECHRAYSRQSSTSMDGSRDRAKVMGIEEANEKALLARDFIAFKNNAFDVIKLLFEYGLRLPTVSRGIYRGQFQELFVPIFGEAKVHDLWLIHQSLQPRVGVMSRMSRAFGLS